MRREYVASLRGVTPRSARHCRAPPDFQLSRQTTLSITIAHVQSGGVTMGKRISRRQFISTGAATTAVVHAIAADPASTASEIPKPAAANPGAGNWVRWLDGRTSAVAQGVTWGTPWPRGTQRESRNFALRGPGDKFQ